MRSILALTGATIITFLLFLVMHSLIIPQGEIFSIKNNDKVIEYVKLRPKPKKKKKRNLKKNAVGHRKKPPQVPALSDISAPAPDLPDINVDLPPLKPAPTLSQLFSPGEAIVSVKIGDSDYGGVGSQLSNGDFHQEIIPHGTVQPAYPKTAAERKIEGWVKVEFTIDKGGHVKDVVVLDSDPKGVFEQTTVNALYTWKYMPIEFPIRARQRIDFKLEQLQYYQGR